jgi:carboxyl-terminal processing protease
MRLLASIAPSRCNRRVRALTPLALAVFALFAALPLAAGDDPAAQLEPEIRRLIEVFNLIDQNAADPIDPDQAIYQGALPGMLRTLDPFSIFFDPDQFAQLQQMQRSETKGFGTIVSVVPGRVTILQTMDGSPAAKAGLSAGDEILAINNIPLAPLLPEQLVQLLSQARQQTAVLDVRKPGNARLFRLTLSPELVDTPSVDRGFLIEPDVAYLRIKSFDQPTGRLTKETIDKLGGAALKGLIIDLRDNPGGAVQAAIDVASLFLKPGQLIFTIKGRAEEQQDARVPKLAQPYSFPVALLVNEKTASAAEILAGALQDHDRATVIGDPTYGKGVVQNVFPLSANTGMALTTAFYYTPSGRSIQKPLPGGSLNVAAKATPGAFHTDSGREVHGGGGIQPDERVNIPNVSQLVYVLDASGALTSFAGEYVQSHEIPADFDVTPSIMDQLRVFLSGHSIQPGIGDWLRDSDLIRSKLKQEIYNLKFGVEKGDEIEMRRDPLVKRAVERLGVH